MDLAIVLDCQGRVFILLCLGASLLFFQFKNFLPSIATTSEMSSLLEVSPMCFPLQMLTYGFPLLTDSSSFCNAHSLAGILS